MPYVKPQGFRTELKELLYSVQMENIMELVDKIEKLHEKYQTEKIKK